MLALACLCGCWIERVREISISEGNMDRGLVHKSSPLVGEMAEAGHGWWGVNNLRPPFEQQHHTCLFMPSTTTTAAPSSSSPVHSFSSLLLSNHYPLPTTSTSPWQHDTSSSHGQQDSWSQLIQYVIHSPPPSLSPCVCDRASGFLVYAINLITQSSVLFLPCSDKCLKN